jgi:hypothetical protein
MTSDHVLTWYSCRCSVLHQSKLLGTHESASSSSVSLVSERSFTRLYNLLTRPTARPYVVLVPRPRARSATSLTNTNVSSERSRAQPCPRANKAVLDPRNHPNPTFSNLNINTDSTSCTDVAIETTGIERFTTL